MKFVPVPITGGQRVLFSVWETRVQDYEVFAKEAKREWPHPGIPQEPTHPAGMVSWDDAQAFCAWLTQRERKAGKLNANEMVRLPSDHEWSCAVGIGEREDAAKIPHGNYSWIKGVIGGHRDRFVETAPVGSFAANRYGLYDLGGNVGGVVRGLV